MIYSSKYEAILKLLLHAAYSRYGGMLSRFDFHFKLGTDHLLSGGGGGLLFFSNILKKIF